MFKLFKDCFKTTNDCIILATPLILFLSAISWYFNYAADSVNSIPKLILAIVTILIMASAFSAAWFYLTKKTLKLSRKVFVLEKDRAKEFKELLLSIPRGIGQLFLPFMGLIFLTSLIYGGLLWGITTFVVNHIGTINIELLDSNNLLLSSNELIEEITGLAKNEIIVIYSWYILVLSGSSILSFLGMLWIPEIIYGEKNPFKALFLGVKKLFLTFPKSLLLFIYINFLLLISSILNTVLMFNPIAYFVVLLLYYYLIVYIVVLLFSYYEQSFIK